MLVEENRCLQHAGKQRNTSVFNSEKLFVAHKGIEHSPRVNCKSHHILASKGCSYCSSQGTVTSLCLQGLAQSMVLELPTSCSVVAVHRQQELRVWTVWCQQHLTALAICG